MRSLMSSLSRRSNAAKAGGPSLLVNRASSGEVPAEPRAALLYAGKDKTHEPQLPD